MIRRPVQRTPEEMFKRLAVQNKQYADWLANPPTDIDALPCMMWIKDVLKKHKVAKVQAAMIGDLEAFVLQHTRVDIVGVTVPGDIREWRSGREFLTVGRTSIEIDYGKLIWLPDSGGLWYESVFMPQTPPVIYGATLIIGNGTKMAYAMACAERRRKLVAPETTTVTGKPLYTIQRLT
jgi:hypothetical protein